MTPDAEALARMKQFAARRSLTATPPVARMRDCVVCGKPFFSPSAARCVCVICRSESTFDGGVDDTH